jgi:hypothetical protein
MTGQAIVFMVVFWGLIIGAVGFSLKSLLKHQKAESNK